MDSPRSLPEVFVVHDGAVTVTAGDETIVVSAGEIVVVPPRTPHKFVNHTDQVARLLTLHASPEAITEWLDE
jgi:mannose-6-phosphate isomerase-like protein (cupin superfamily)